MKKSLVLILVVAVCLIAVLAAFPFIEINTGKKLVRLSYTGDFSEYDVNHSYNELYCYNQKHDVSIKSFDVKNFLCFYAIEMEYVKGDFRKTQFVLNESYIQNFLQNAAILENENNIDLSELIKGKTAIVGNTRYTGNDYENAIYYELDGRDGEMYIFNFDDLLVIQVGSSDELPKFIAYK